MRSGVPAGTTNSISTFRIPLGSADCACESAAPNQTAIKERMETRRDHIQTSSVCRHAHLTVWLCQFRREQTRHPLLIQHQAHTTFPPNLFPSRWTLACEDSL